MHRVRFVSLLAALLGFAGVARTDSVAPAEVLDEPRRAALAEASQRAFDQIRSARAAIAFGEPLDARRATVLARHRMLRARAASPALHVRDEIDAALTELDAPEAEIAPEVLDRILDALDGAGAPERFFPSRRYVERAHYWQYRGSRDSIVRELASASARLPLTELDAALDQGAALAGQALLRLYEGDGKAADGLLSHAERIARGALGVANGGPASLLYAADPQALDAAAPPVGAPAPSGPRGGAPVTPAGETATESDFAPPPAFREPPLP